MKATAPAPEPPLRSTVFIYSPHRSKPFFSLFFIPILLLIFLAGCGPKPEKPLRIGTNKWPGYEPLYLARNLGYYENSQVNLVELTSASEVIRAIRSGNLEGAALTLDETLTLLIDGFDLKIILVMDFSDGADVLLAKPPISSINELKGKRVAVEYTAVGAIILDAALEKAGLKADEIEIVACSVDEQISKYPTVDAVVTFEPYRTKLLQLGATQLFDSSEIPGQITDVLVVSQKTIDNHPKALKTLLDGYFKARNYFEVNQADACKRMSARLAIAPEQVQESFQGLLLPTLEGNHTLLNGSPSQIEDTAEELTAMMYRKRLLKEVMPISNITTPSFLPSYP